MIIEITKTGEEIENIIEAAFAERLAHVALLKVEAIIGKAPCIVDVAFAEINARNLVAFFIKENRMAPATAGKIQDMAVLGRTELAHEVIDEEPRLVVVAVLIKDVVVFGVEPGFKPRFSLGHKHAKF